MRRCTYGGCETILSRFNPGERCALHPKPLVVHSDGRAGRENVGGRPPSVDYQKVANAYDEAVENGWPIQEQVARMMDVPAKLAATYISRARKRGLIPPVTPLEEHQEHVRQAEDEIYGKADQVHNERARSAR